MEDEIGMKETELSKEREMLAVSKASEESLNSTILQLKENLSVQTSKLEESTSKLDEAKSRMQFLKSSTEGKWTLSFLVFNLIFCLELSLKHSELESKVQKRGEAVEQLGK